MAEVESRDRSTILIHYYRAMVGRADVWRVRMDATTNWAIGATAATISFALANPALPHFVVFIASLLTLCFLLLEARRLTFYHLWQQRVLLLERGLIRPVLWWQEPSSEPARGADGSPEASFERELDTQLGSTVPTMSLWKAAARRLRRIYVYLFGVQLLAWILKLSSHPTPARSLGSMIARAQTPLFSGRTFLALALLAFAAAVALAVFLGGVDRETRPGSRP